MEAINNFNLHSLADTLLSLVVAFILGSLIGLERQVLQRTAGLRSYALMRGAVGPMQLWIASITVAAGVVQFFRLPFSVGPVVRPFVLIAPVVASFLGWALSSNDQAPLAHVSGFVGILVGSDRPVARP